MDWTKQVDEMVKTWTGAQQKMWENWIEAMQMMSSPQSAGNVWEKTVDAWRETVKKALESQVSWTKLWAENMTANPNTPKEMGDWAKQVLDMTQAWTDAQAQMSDNWFEVMKKADPMTVAKLWDQDQAKKMLQAWQDASQKAMEAQREWARMVTTMQPKAEG